MIRALLLVAMVLPLIVALSRRRSRRSPVESGTRENVSLAIREKVLSREFLAGLPPAATDVARCVLMDWNLGGDRAATLVAYDDATTSLYFSTGGGVIGAGAHEGVRRAAAAFRDQAAADRTHFAPATRLDLPPTGMTTFYLVTDAATHSSGPIANSELQAGTHPLATLAARGQDLITQVRVTSERRRDGPEDA